MKYNLQQACWLQFNVHFFDRIKAKERSERAIEILKEFVVESVPKEIETFIFLN